MALKFGRRSEKETSEKEYEFLSRTEIFNGLPDDLLQYIFNNSKLTIYPPGSTVFIEGTVDLDLAVDSKQRIFALDQKKKAVRIFSKK